MMGDDDDYSKTCGPVLDRRNPVNLDELFVPLGVKSKECENLLVVVEEESATAEDDASAQLPTETAAVDLPLVVDPKATSLVNDINTRFSNDCTQTVGPYLDTADPSRKVSVRDLFKPLDCKSKEIQNLAEEHPSDEEEGGAESTGDGHQTSAGTTHHDAQQTQTCGPVIIDDTAPVKPNLERIFHQNLDEVPFYPIIRRVYSRDKLDSLEILTFRGGYIFKSYHRPPRILITVTFFLVDEINPPAPFASAVSYRFHGTAIKLYDNLRSAEVLLSVYYFEHTISRFVEFCSNTIHL